MASELFKKYIKLFFLLCACTYACMCACVCLCICWCVCLACWCPRNMLHLPTQYPAPNSPNTQVIIKEVRKEGSFGGVDTSQSGSEARERFPMRSVIRTPDHGPLSQPGCPSLSPRPCSGHLSGWKVLTWPCVTTPQMWVTSGPRCLMSFQSRTEISPGQSAVATTKLSFPFYCREKVPNTIISPKETGCWVVSRCWVGVWFTAVVPKQQITGTTWGNSL